MDVDADLQNSVQNPLQQGVQANPPGDPSPPAIPANSVTPHPPPASDTDGIDARRLRSDILRALSKTFGHIPDVPIFTHWDKRTDCSNSAVHRSIMAGICGSSQFGAYSVALSGSYRDDEDGGDVIIYTGTGGRRQWTDTNPPKRLRLGPQVEDQSWDMHLNKSLIVSFHTGNPVRVIRSSRLLSQYAPLRRGYRYDGLYKVVAYWTAKGCNEKKICRCRLERLPDQPPIPVRPITFRASGRRPREHLVSFPASNLSTCVGPNQTNTSPMQSTGGAEREPGELPSVPQQQALSKTLATCEVDSVEVPPKPRVLPVYRWDPKKNELVRVPIQEDLDTAEEDDATLVPSEDGHGNECMETE